MFWKDFFSSSEQLTFESDNVISYNTFSNVKGADLVRILKKSIFFAFSKSRIFQKYSLKIPDKSDYYLSR